MDSPLLYCSDGYATLQRLRSLYEERNQDVVLASMQAPSETLRDFARRHRDGYCQYPNPDERAAFWDAYLSERADIRDDSIPSAYLTELDQGLYGGLVGGDVRFLCTPETGWISSMVPPILSDLTELDRLAFDEESEWFRRYVHQLEVFVRAAEGKFGVGHFILIDGLNFVFELIGATNTYLELDTRTELVEKAIDFAFDMNVRVQEEFFGKALLEGGTCSNMAQWIPGRVVSESVDPFHMTSVDYFERWGREPVERVFSQFDGGVIHIHGNGRHLLSAVAAVQGLKAIRLLDDRGIPKAFEELHNLKRLTKDVPLIVDVEFPVFREAIRRDCLMGGVLYMVNSVPSVNAANNCMDLLRERAWNS